MKKVERIKNSIDTMYVKQAQSWIEQIRLALNIKKNESIFTLDGNKWNYFLYKNKVIIADIEYPEGLKKDSAIYAATLLPNKNINLEKIKGNELYTKGEFLLWLKQPCIITEMVDKTNFEVIKFLQKYKEGDFCDGNYLYYVKPDKDYSLSFNIYAKDLKSKMDFKIYVEMDLPLTTVMPKTIKDIFVDDLSNSATKYRISKLKKSFFEFIKKDYSVLGVNNFFALELVKQAIQPVEQDFGKFACCVFYYNETNLADIYVDDFLVFDKKPYFLLEKSYKNFSKIAALDFYNPRYKTGGIYKNAHNKSLFWELNEDEIEELINFLNSHCKNNKEKTNWQYLIERYNYNTGEVWDETVKEDLKMPDYRKLLQTNKDKK